MISIVIPTYNERSNVGKNVEEIETILKDYDFEIIFVDDNSPDGTSEKVRDAYLRDGRVRVVKRIGRRGLSSAIFEGICNARYELCCIVDADLQYDLSKLTDAIEEFQKEPGTDLVIFSRDMIGNREKTNLSKFRYYMTTLSSRIAADCSVSALIRTRIFHHQEKCCRILCASVVADRLQISPRCTAGTPEPVGCRSDNIIQRTLVGRKQNVVRRVR